MRLCLNKALFLPGQPYNTEPEKVMLRCDSSEAWLGPLPWLALFLCIQPGIIFGTEDLLVVGIEFTATVRRWSHRWPSQKGVCPKFGLPWKNPHCPVVTASSWDQKLRYLSRGYLFMVIPASPSFLDCLVLQNTGKYATEQIDNLCDLFSP